MSSPLAIAAVTRLLMDLLNNGLIDGDISSTIGNVTVSALPPDKIDTGTESTQLNLFMYQTSPNTGWNNIGYPTFSSRGDRVSNSPLALNLHYMMSAYGSRELHSEILLGYAMQLLHERPVLIKDEIRNALLGTTVAGDGLTPELRALQSVKLDEQVESIKVTPEYLGTEELSRLWTAFQTNYRPSAFYQVTVVLIESYKSTKVALPVKQRNIIAFPFAKPTITGISSRISSADPFLKNEKILISNDLAIEGYDLKNEHVTVIIDKKEIIPDINDISPDQIIIDLPPDLFAGIHGIRVAHSLMIGSPPEARYGTQSNVEAFVLSPDITNVNVTDVAQTGSTVSATVNVSVNPPIGMRQNVILILNSTSGNQSYSFLADLPLQSPPGSLSVLNIPVKRVVPGNYLVRLQVDGAESILGTDTNGRYNSPLASIIP